MSEEKKNDMTMIYIIMIFVGMYMFLFGFIRRWATSGWTVFFGGLSVFFVELFGAIVLYDYLNKVHNPKLAGFYQLFFMASGFFLLLVIKAYCEHRRFYSMTIEEANRWLDR